MEKKSKHMSVPPSTLRCSASMTRSRYAESALKRKNQTFCFGGAQESSFVFFINDLYGYSLSSRPKLSASRTFGPFYIRHRPLRSFSEYSTTTHATNLLGSLTPVPEKKNVRDEQRNKTRSWVQFSPPPFAGKSSSMIDSECYSPPPLSHRIKKISSSAPQETTEKQRVLTQHRHTSLFGKVALAL